MDAAPAGTLWTLIVSLVFFVNVHTARTLLNAIRCDVLVYSQVRMSVQKYRQGRVFNNSSEDSQYIQESHVMYNHTAQCRIISNLIAHK